MDDIELTADEDLTGSRLILHHRIHFHGSLTGRDITVVSRSRTACVNDDQLYADSLVADRVGAGESDL